MTSSKLIYSLFALSFLLVFLHSPKAQAGGTHFLVQIQGGFAFSPADDMGSSVGYGLMMGYGGRLRGTRLRFYGLLSYDRARFHGSGTQADMRWRSERAYNDFQAGLRLLLPIWWHLRWYAEAFLGASLLTGNAEWTDGFRVESRRATGMLTAATGLEFRWLRHFATGIRVDFRWMMANADILSSQSQLDDSKSFRSSVLLTQAFLF